MSRFSVWIVVTAIGWGAAAISTPCLAWPGGHNYASARAAAKKKAAIAQLRSQLQAAKQDEAVAESELAQAQARNRDVTQDLSRTRETLEHEKANVSADAAELRRLEASILDAQADDSPLAKAKERLDLARRAYLVEEHRVTQSPELKKQLDDVATDERHAQRAAELQESAIQQDRDAALAKSRLLESSDVYHRLRFEALSNDSRWAEAVAARRVAKDELTWNENEAAKHGIRGLSTKQELRLARSRADAAQMRVAAISDQLRRLGVDPDKKAPQTPKRTPKT